MKILVAGDFLVSWREEAWVNAFKVHGHTVNSICINGLKSDSFPVVNKFINKLAFLINFKNSINKNFVNDCLKNNYDLIFLSRPILITKKSIEEIKQNTKSIIVLYQNDSMFEKADSILWRYIKACIPLYDLCLIYRESDRKYYERII